MSLRFVVGAVAIALLASMLSSCRPLPPPDSNTISGPAIDVAVTVGTNGLAALGRSANLLVEPKAFGEVLTLPATFAWLSVMDGLFGCVFHNQLLDLTDTEKRTAAEIAMPAIKTGAKERFRLAMFLRIR